MFDCLDNAKPNGTVEECYQKYLERIIAVNTYEEIISITHEFDVFVRYKRTNRHGTRIFSVWLIDDNYPGRFGMLHLTEKNIVIFKLLDENFLIKELIESVKEAYPAERLQKVAKLAQLVKLE